MPRICTICPHEAREEVEDAVLRGEPIRSIARRIGGVGEDAIRRHIRNHLSAALQRSIDEERIDVTAERLIAWTTQLQRKTLELLARAERGGDLRAARAFVKEARANIHLLGRIAGILEPSPHVSVEWKQQIQVLQRLSEEELRALAKSATEADVEPERVPPVFPALPMPPGARDRDASPASMMGGQG
jgi:hypothetical protein